MKEIELLSMPLEEALRTQRAIRRLKADPVDDALVRRLIELALKAPTGSNAQNWEFIVVRDPAVKARLGLQNRRAWRLYGGLGRRVARGDAKMQKVLDAVQWQADHFEDIPVLVVACLKAWIPPWPSIASSSLYGSIYRRCRICCWRLALRGSARPSSRCRSGARRWRAGRSGSRGT